MAHLKLLGRWVEAPPPKLRNAEVVDASLESYKLLRLRKSSVRADRLPLRAHTVIEKIAAAT